MVFLCPFPLCTWQYSYKMSSSEMVASSRWRFDLIRAGVDAYVWNAFVAHFRIPFILRQHFEPPFADDQRDANSTNEIGMSADLRIKPGMARRRQMVLERGYLLLQQRQCLQAWAVVESLALHQAQEITPDCSR
jgi:hypothetical protein